MGKIATSAIDRLASRRAMIAIVLGAFFITRSSSIFIFNIEGAGLQVTLSPGLSTAAWLAWMTILLLFALFAGGLWLSASVRQRLNDESTLANWRASIHVGFWAMIVGAFICMVANDYVPLTARGAVQVMVSLGVGMALIRFGATERGAMRA